jgi:hypothetical protein
MQLEIQSSKYEAEALKLEQRLHELTLPESPQS